MEDEIDLGKYVKALIRRWRVILLMPLVLALAALVMFKFVRPAPFEAVATVAIVKWQADVTLDPNFRTLSDQDLNNAGFYARADARRNALAGLVTSGTLAERVVARMGDRLPVADRQPTRLLAMVAGDADGKSDLLRIRVRHSDPQVAAELATTWATEYEQYVNDIYSSKPSLSAAVLAELDRTQHAYQQSQQQLELFMAGNRIESLTRQITMTQQIVRDLQQETLAALSTTIQQRLKLRAALIEQYLTAQHAAQSAVISKEVEARTTMLADQYAAQVELERLIGRAQAFRAQLAAGGAASAASSELALILLKAQVFTDQKSMPTTFQLTLGAASGQHSQAAYLADLDALIMVLEQRRAEIARAIDTAKQELLAVQTLPATDRRATSPVQKAAAEQLAQLLDLDGLENLVPKAEQSALVAKIDEQAAKLAALRSALEREQAHERQLTQQRDLAWETYMTVARKQSEVDITNTVQGSEVHMVDAAIVPQRRAYSALVGVLLACALGVLAGVVLALVADAAIGRRPQVALPGRGNASWQRAVHWMLNEPVLRGDSYSRSSHSSD